MKEEKLEYIKKWLIKANEDILVIDQLFKYNPEYYTSAICFHSQQAVEKFLKAFLAYNNIDFKKTHDLDYLLSECKKIDKKNFKEIDLKSLTDFGINIRYPDDFYIPDLEETINYKDIAFQIKSVIENILKIN